jgi:hypothetical protein
VTKNARILTSVIISLCVSAVLVGCDVLGLSGPSGPGELYANILSPDGAVDGAVVLEITGPTGSESITSDFGDVFFERDGNITRVVLVLDDPGLLSFQMRVEDVSELPTVTIVQVADGNNQLRTSVSEYETEWVQLSDSDRDLHRGAQ